MTVGGRHYRSLRERKQKHIDVGRKGAGNRYTRKDKRKVSKERKILRQTVCWEKNEEGKGNLTISGRCKVVEGLKGE